MKKQGSKNIMFNETPKSRSRVSKMRLSDVQNVVPSVSDGVLNPPSRREGTLPEQMSKMVEETNNRYVQRDSKVSELFEKLIAVMFNETPKSRSCLKN